MVRLRQTLGTALLLSVSCAIGPSLCAQTQTPQPPPPRKSGAASVAPATKATTKAKGQHKKSEPVAEVSQAPPPPPTLEQQPPVAPQVSYRDGLLTISATNSTLSQILQSVQSKTGATVDIPPGGGSERVATTIGPGKPQSVLATLLNGSKFNYVILGEPNNSGAVQKVILLAKSGGPGGDPSSAAAQNNFRSQPPQPQGVEPPDDDPQSEPEVDQNQLQPGAQGFPGSENIPQEVINPGGRTPEQMLQDLQRMQEQQQQMQQQLNPANQQQPFGQPFNSNSPQPQPAPLPSQPQAAPQPQ